VTRIGRWWSSVAGAPMRAFARHLWRRLPHDSYASVDLVIGDPTLAGLAQPFFARTSAALRLSEERAPRSYARFRRDVGSVVLVADPPAAPYHRFQLAVLVPKGVALADEVSYAAWLLYASGLSASTREAGERASELLSTLDEVQRDDVLARLPSRLVMP
jgi:hypothetical protein